MKHIAGLIALILLLSFRPPNSIYDITLKDINGNSIALSQFKGKKLLFIVLPVSDQDTTVSAGDIARLQTKYQGSLVIIGIPSEEGGYKIQDAAKLKRIYRDVSPSIIIAQCMKVKKGEGQSTLFQWLTNKDMNRHFNQDAEEAGNKFFLDEGGDLYAVLGSRISLTNPLLDRVITRQQGRKNDKR